MPRICIAAALAFLVLLAPTASARLIDEPAPAKAAHYLVQSERITDHAPTWSGASTIDHTAIARAQERYYDPEPTAGKPGETAIALAQERYYGAPRDVYAMKAREQKAAANDVVPRPDDDSPFAIIALGIAGTAVLAGGVTLIARRTRAGATA